MEAKMEDKMKRTSKPDIIIKRKLVKRGRRKKCLLDCCPQPVGGAATTTLPN